MRFALLDTDIVFMLTRLRSPAEASILRHMPAFVADTGRAPKHVAWVNLAFDL